MSYYWFNRQEILQKAKERYSRQKAAEYYLKNKRGNKRKVKKLIQNLVTRKKVKVKEYQRKTYQELIQYEEEALQNK